MRRIGLVILLCAMFISGVAAASSTGSLTSAEYVQLVTVQDKLKAVNGKTAAGLKAALWDCETIQELTPLLTAMRSDCIAQLQLAESPAIVHVLVKTCAVYKTLAEKFRCMIPTYNRLYAINASYYRSESAIHRIAMSRHFTASCANFLSDPSNVIADEKRTVIAFRLMLGAMKTYNGLAAQKYSGELTTADAELAQAQKATSKGPLSICSHQ